MLPARSPAEVICHGDIAPYNSAVRDGRVIGFIDFDTAHPAPRLGDVAYAVYRYAPLHAPENPDRQFGRSFPAYLICPDHLVSGAAAVPDHDRWGPAGTRATGMWLARRRGGRGAVRRRAAYRPPASRAGGGLPCRRLSTRPGPAPGGKPRSGAAAERPGIDDGRPRWRSSRPNLLVTTNPTPGAVLKDPVGDHKGRSGQQQHGTDPPARSTPRAGRDLRKVS